jgi:hypothetical protein
LNFDTTQAYARCGIGETALAILGRDKGSHAILPSGRIGGVAFERVAQRPHLAAAQIEVKEQVELELVVLYRHTIAGGGSSVGDGLTGRLLKTFPRDLLARDRG